MALFLYYAILVVFSVPLYVLAHVGYFCFGFPVILVVQPCESISRYAAGCAASFDRVMREQEIMSICLGLCVLALAAFFVLR